jgi:choice-of-anchor A domain-containing protein/MYXO-CTERM domain-containing protein
MKKLWVLTLVLNAVMATSAQAATIDLGQAANYNAFIKDNFTANTSDTRGSLAVGGNLIIQPGNGGSGGYSIGYGATGTGPSLVVGGDIVKTGDGWLNVHKNGNNVGNAVYAGKLNVANTQWGGQPFSANATKVSAANLPVDFNAAFAHLTTLSAQLASQTTAATTTKTEILTFTPAKATADNVYVFNLTQEDFNRYQGFNVQGVNKDALIVFNISNPNKVASSYNNNAADAAFCKKGEANCVVFSQKSVYLNGVNAASGTIGTADPTAPLASQILYNFKDVARLKIASDVYGTILSPKAAIETNQGVVWGQVIAKSWKGNAEIDPAPLKPPVGTNPPVVSEPPLWAALLLLVAGLLLSRRRSQPLPAGWNPITA